MSTSERYENQRQKNEKYNMDKDLEICKMVFQLFDEFGTGYMDVEDMYDITVNYLHQDTMFVSQIWKNMQKPYMELQTKESGEEVNKISFGQFFTLLQAFDNPTTLSQADYETSNEKREPKMNASSNSIDRFVRTESISPKNISNPSLNIQERTLPHVQIKQNHE